MNHKLSVSLCLCGSKQLFNAIEAHLKYELRITIYAVARRSCAGRNPACFLNTNQP